jgi:hypothetical protein
LEGHSSGKQWHALDACIRQHPSALITVEDLLPKPAKARSLIPQPRAGRRDIPDDFKLVIEPDKRVSRLLSRVALAHRLGVRFT